MMNEKDITIINNRIAAERREKLERLRHELTAAALTGLLTGANARNYETPPTDLAAKLAVAYADAAIKVLEQPK